MNLEKRIQTELNGWNQHKHSECQRIHCLSLGDHQMDSGSPIADVVMIRVEYPHGVRSSPLTLPADPGTSCPLSWMWLPISPKIETVFLPEEKHRDQAPEISMPSHPEGERGFVRQWALYQSSTTPFFIPLHSSPSHSSLWKLVLGQGSAVEEKSSLLPREAEK